MKKLLLILGIFFFLGGNASAYSITFKPLVTKPLLDITYFSIVNVQRADNSCQVQVFLDTDYPIFDGTVQYHIVIQLWEHYYDFFSHSWKWGWKPCNFSIFIPPGSTEGFTYAELQPGEYASTTDYTIYPPSVQ